MHARDVYRTMVRDTITPALRERGFRGGSGSYYLDSPAGHTSSVLLSGNPKRSTDRETHFDIHIGVQSAYTKQWDEAIGDKPRKPSVWSDHDWLDTVPPPSGPFDNYTIGADADPAEVGTQILEVLDTRAIPAVRASLDDEGLRRAVDTCFVGTGRGVARILLDIAQGHLEPARARIADIVERSGAEDPGSVFLLERLAASEQR